MTPSDPLYGQQWHFSLIGDIETIWDEFDGTGVHVGVFDDGIQYTHPDLAANYDASKHFRYQGVTYDGIANDPDGFTAPRLPGSSRRRMTMAGGTG
ncbi:MAG: hypothetical protein HZT43_00095 [Exiguobacterium profundum]|nr:MAG: hypothetical protein HZT43_00095 [Exiguobacterium profundum]